MMGPKNGIVLQLAVTMVEVYEGWGDELDGSNGIMCGLGYIEFGSV